MGYDLLCINMKQLTIILALLMTIGSQVSANGSCDKIGGSFRVIQEKPAALTMWLELELGLKSSDGIKKLEAENKIIMFERKYGRGSGEALANYEYDKWLAKQSCGLVDDVRPKSVGMEKKKLIKLCLEHLPKTALEKGAIYMLRLNDTDVFLVYGEKGRCRLFRYD